MNTKFALMERVTSKKTGFPQIGYVHSIMTPIMYCASYGITTKEEAVKFFPKWSGLYPDWIDKMLFGILFDSPSRTCTFEEFKKVSPNASNKDYEELVKPRYCAMYPEDDLERFEE